ncbi:unnamed protein product [Hymenolepis diminuta]|uniref:HMA domain-containing protein n=1 Tax=Hymenolepis diminuta TaxID=6216 RepID=A0A0R3SAZ8_HYMDI|nr:unnamed protein product [Hymenolepis diminuta]
MGPSSATLVALATQQAQASCGFDKVEVEDSVVILTVPLNNAKLMRGVRALPPRHVRSTRLNASQLGMAVGVVEQAGTKVEIRLNF